MGKGLVQAHGITGTEPQVSGSLAQLTYRHQWAKLETAKAKPGHLFIPV